MNKVRVRIINRGGNWVAEARSRPYSSLDEAEIFHYNNGFSGDDEVGDFTRIIWHIKQDGIGTLQFVPKAATPLQVFHLAAGVKNVHSAADTDTNPDGSRIFQNLRRVDTDGDGFYEKLTIDVYNKNHAPKNSGLFNRYAYTLNLNYTDGAGTRSVTIDPMIADYSEYD